MTRPPEPVESTTPTVGPIERAVGAVVGFAFIAALFVEAVRQFNAGDLADGLLLVAAGSILLRLK